MAPTARSKDVPKRNYYAELPGEEIYLTGVSGYFPESDSVKQLQENLFNKVSYRICDLFRVPYQVFRIASISKRV